MAVGRVEVESRHDAEKATIEVEALVTDPLAMVVGRKTRHDAEKMQPMIKLSNFIVMLDRYDGDHDED
jgi:hypothetical protein